MPENPESFYDFIHPKVTGPEGFLYEVYSNNSAHAVAREVLQSALGDLPRFCMHCGGFCDTHIIALRDAFLNRAADLSQKLIKFIEVYNTERDLGILEPEHLTYRIFELWNKLGVLYALSEPQDYMDPVIEDEEEDEGETSDGE